MNLPVFVASLSCLALLPIGAVVAQSEPVVVARPVDSSSDALPLNTLVLVTPKDEITSKKMKEGTKREFLVVEDVVHDGMVIIPRGSPVEATVTWRTGKGIVGKSAKFELSFDWVRIGSHNWKLRGSHRQEGRGNTAGALLGSMIITGRSATMSPGQIVNVFTAEPIPFRSQETESEAKAEAAKKASGAETTASTRRPVEIRVGSPST